MDELSRGRSVPLARQLGPAAAAARLWLVLLLIVALAGSLLFKPRPLLLWNATPSSPVGLYAIVDRPSLRVGDTVVAWAPAAARRLAAARDYLPFTVPLVKPVAATEGDRICATGTWVLINNHLAATRLRRDPSGRPMPCWRGCTKLKQGELFLLSSGDRNAFDGRYFGVTHPSQLVGGAWLLWRR